MNAPRFSPSGRTPISSPGSGSPSEAPGSNFLGSYRLVDEIGQGGMASVHLARLDGAGGFQKWVAIKRILPHLLGEEQFIHMFLDEARIAARISHANVAQVFELGEGDGNYWIAMEYLHGEPLREVIRCIDEGAPPMSYELAARIIADAAEGLHAAHELRDKNGELLGLVHRDVTPHNLFVTYEGTVKVVDFGVAKAAGRLSSTRAGTLKGKAPYMSPEHVQGKKVDRRADVFALGIVLWELTTNKRLFAAEDDLDVLELVRNCKIQRPSELRRSFPAQLEQIILKALAKSPDQRFASARDLSRELQKFLMNRGALVGSEQISAYLRELLGDRIKERDAHLNWAAEVTRNFLPEDLLVSVSETGAIPRPPARPASVAPPRPQAGPPRPAQQPAAPPRPSVAPPRPAALPPAASALPPVPAPAMLAPLPSIAAAPAPLPSLQAAPPPLPSISVPAPAPLPSISVPAPAPLPSISAPPPAPLPSIAAAPPARPSNRAPAARPSTQVSPSRRYSPPGEDDPATLIAPLADITSRRRETLIVRPAEARTSQQPPPQQFAQQAPQQFAQQAPAPQQFAPQQPAPPQPPQQAYAAPAEQPPTHNTAPPAMAYSAPTPSAPVQPPQVSPGPYAAQPTGEFTTSVPSSITIKLPKVRRDHMVAVASVLGTLLVVGGLSLAMREPAEEENRAHGEPLKTGKASDKKSQTPDPPATTPATIPTVTAPVATVTATAPVATAPVATATAQPTALPGTLSIGSLPVATNTAGQGPNTGSPASKGPAVPKVDDRPPPPSGGGTGTISIVCKPACDAVVVKGRDLGPSPVINVSLPAGTYPVLLKRSGAPNQSSSITVTEGKNSALRVNM